MFFTIYNIYQFINLYTHHLKYKKYKKILTDIEDSNPDKPGYRLLHGCLDCKQPIKFEGKDYLYLEKQFISTFSKYQKGNRCYTYYCSNIQVGSGFYIENINIDAFTSEICNLFLPTEYIVKTSSAKLIKPYLSKFLDLFCKKRTHAHVRYIGAEYDSTKKLTLLGYHNGKKITKCYFLSESDERKLNIIPPNECSITKFRKIFGKILTFGLIESLIFYTIFTKYKSS